MKLKSPKINYKEKIKQGTDVDIFKNVKKESFFKMKNVWGDK